MKAGYARLVVTDSTGRVNKGNWSDEPLTLEEMEELNNFFERFFKESQRGFVTLDQGTEKVIFNSAHVVSVKAEVKEAK